MVLFMASGIIIYKNPDEKVGGEEGGGGFVGVEGVKWG